MNDINNWKKQRDMRLKNNNHNRTQSPVAIKIEDDSDEETPETPVTSTHASNVVNGHQPSNHNTTTRTTVDRAVQTENVLLMQVGFSISMGYASMGGRCNPTVLFKS